MPLCFNRFAHRVSFAAITRHVMVLYLPPGGDNVSRDAPSSRTQSRRSMYLLRRRVPVKYFSDDEVVVLSGESSDKEDTPSSGGNEQNLNQESAVPETTGGDESVSSRLSCLLPTGQSQHSIEVCLNLRYFYRK